MSPTRRIYFVLASVMLFDGQAVVAMTGGHIISSDILLAVTNVRYLFHLADLHSSQRCLNEKKE